MELQNKKPNKLGIPSVNIDFFGWFVLFWVSTGVIAIERFSPLLINSFYVRLIFYILSASLFVFWLSWILLGFKAIRARVLIFVVVVLICIAKSLLTWGSDWKTQTILYQNSESNFLTIDYQMRGDLFAFGYKERIVERRRIMPFFDWIKDTDTTALDPKQWKRVDLEVNEMEIPNHSGMPK